MSTRTNIHFCNAPGDIVSNIYRHCDGYPSGVLPDLVEFFEAVGRLNDTRFGDAEYLAAKFIVWQAAQYASQDSPLDFLSVAPCVRDHGDIEYIYEIICDGGWRDEKPPRVRWRSAYDSAEWNDWRSGDPIPD